METAFAATDAGIDAFEAGEIHGTEYDIINELPSVGMACTIEGAAAEANVSESAAAKAINRLIKKGFLKVVWYTEEWSRAVMGKEASEAKRLKLMKD